MLQRRILIVAGLTLAIALLSPSRRAAVHAGQVAWPVAGPTEVGHYALDLTTGTVIRTSGGRADIAWSPDDSKLATAGSAVTILDVDSGKSSIVPGTDVEFKNPGGPNGPVIPIPYRHYVANGPVQWSPDGSSLAFIGMEPGDAVAPGLVMYRVGEAQIRTLRHFFNGTYAWTPDGRFLTTLSSGIGEGGRNRTVQNIDPRTGETTELLTDARGFSSFAWSADGDYLALAGFGPRGFCTGASASQTGIWIWEAATGALKQVYAGGHGGMKWSGDDWLLAEVCGSEETKPREPLWYALERFAPDGGVADVLVDGVPDPDATLFDAAFDIANGAVVYTAKDCRAGTASTWVLDAGSMVPRQLSAPASYVSESRLSPDGDTIASITLAANGSELTLVPLDVGVSRTLLTTSKALTNPWWSAGGRWLNFEVTRSGYKDCLNS